MKSDTVFLGVFFAFTDPPSEHDTLRLSHERLLEVNQWLKVNLEKAQCLSTRETEASFNKEQGLHDYFGQHVLVRFIFI